MRLFGITCANWPLLSNYKKNKLDKNWNQILKFDLATRNDAEIEDHRFRTNKIEAEEY